MPVIFGSLKSTIYAMLFATPLALFAAVYVSHFTTPGWKNAIKPVVEIMAAVPSVVVGFLILLWLPPLIGEWIVGVFVSLLTLPLTFVAFMLVWQWVRKYDWAGNLQWSATYNSPAGQSDVAYAVAIDAADDIYVVGSEHRTDLGPLEYFGRIVKYSPTGSVIWSRTFQYGATVPQAVTIDRCGNAVVAGWIQNGERWGVGVCPG